MSEMGRRKAQSPGAPGLGRVAVVGSGAIGGFYGAMLARNGEDVHFLARSDYEAMREYGLRIETLDETFTLPPGQIPAYQSTGDIGRVDTVLIAIKATANDVLPELLSPLVGPQTRLVTLQNGMGNAELLARCFGGERVVGGLCFVCLNRTAPGVVKNTNRGRVTFAALQPEGHPAAEALRMGFEAAGIKADVLDSLDEALWRKLVWNIPFNGLAIAAGCVTTDIICADPSLRSLAWKLMREVQAAAASEDHQISDRFLEKQMERTAPMGPYQPSSLIDFQGNRAVEVEAIWGEPLRRARESGCPSPHLESLYLLLKGLVETRGK